MLKRLNVAIFGVGGGERGQWRNSKKISPASRSLATSMEMIRDSPANYLILKDSLANYPILGKWWFNPEMNLRTQLTMIGALLRYLPNYSLIVE